MVHSSYPHSNILVLGQSCIYSLLPSTLFAQVESLLRNGKLGEANVLLEQVEAEGSTSVDLLRYLHQCLAFVFLRQTRFREASFHFIKGAVDPRIPVSYFDELRPALFSEPRDDTAIPQAIAVEVEVWDGVKEYMPNETSVDDIIATNLVRNYSPYLRPGALPSSSAGDESIDAESSISDSLMKSGTRTHLATIAMREGLREEANEMLKGILAAVLANPEMWSRDVIEATSTALALLYAHARDVHSLLTLFAPLSSAHPSSSRPVSRASSRPSSRPSSISHPYPSNVPPNQHTRHTSQATSRSFVGCVLPFRPGVLAPVLAQLNLWHVTIEMWKVFEDGEKIVDVLVGLTEGTYVDPLVVDPMEQIFTLLSPTRSDVSDSVNSVGLNLNEQERNRLVKKWAAWLAGKDVERGIKLLTSLHPTRHRRPTGAASRGRDKAVDREKDASSADELLILSELRNINALAAKRYLEWLVVGRGIGRGGKETTEEGELFEELVRNCVDEVVEYASDESIGKLWKAKVASYASSVSATASVSKPLPPSPESDAPLSLVHQAPQSPLRSPFLGYFSSTTPDSPSKRVRIKTLLLLQSLKEGKKLVKDIQDRITDGGWDKILGLEMAILYSKVPSARTTLETLYVLRDTLTAESYASNGGLTGVISTKVGVSAAEGCSMTDWSAWFTRGSGGAMMKEEQGSVDMLKMLLEVYMEDGNMQHSARFLSSQAKKLDTLDILPVVPPTWPLSSLSTFLARSLRRTQHTAHEGQIVRALCAGQNLAVLENTFEVLREEGAIVEEAVSDDEGGDGEGVGGKSFDEKVVLHGGSEGEAEVVNVDLR